MSVLDHESLMRAAMAEAERARGRTGDNPWVGCVIADRSGAIVARGHTQGPGEDHAEIGALRQAREAAIDLREATLYSTLEPCSFHGRTPACARVIAESGVGRVVVAIRDPHPRVDGVGAEIVRAAGIEVVEDVCAREVRLQLAPWIFQHHPHEPLRRARELRARDPHVDLVAVLRDVYGLDDAAIRALVDENISL